MKKVSTKTIAALSLAAAILIPTLNFERVNANTMGTAKTVAKVESKKLDSRTAGASTPVVVTVVSIEGAALVLGTAALLFGPQLPTLSPPNSMQTKLSMLD